MGQRLGTIAVCGDMEDTVTFGEGEANETTLTASGERDPLVALYDPAGSLLWARAAGGPKADLCAGVAIVDADKGAVIAGFFSETAVFGNG
ncbi:MAG: hypothetical protein HYV63_06630, partial [Candidatus Schekmanbacteria bacterium]|nr:hypothetical protein [Candidatus Schekmanbacteria bacterium]